MALDEVISVRFRGPSADDGVMDVHDLGPSLIGLAELVEEASQVVSKGKAIASLRVRGPFRKGSFEVVLDFLGDAYSGAIRFANTPEAIAWLALLTLLDLNVITAGKGVISLVKRLRGRKPDKNFRQLDNGLIGLTLPDGEVIEATQEVVELLKNSRARQGLQRLVKPLHREGVNDIEFEKDGKTAVRIWKEEAAFFSAPFVHDEELVTESERFVRIVKMSFKKGHKWTVSDAGQRYSVSILDDAFFERLTVGSTRVGSRDLFRVVLRTRQWRDGDELKAAYEITKVIEELPQVGARPLPFPDNDPPSKPA